jgi:hypothetical protein
MCRLDTQRGSGTIERGSEGMMDPATPAARTVRRVAIFGLGYVGYRLGGLPGEPWALSHRC